MVPVFNLNLPPPFIAPNKGRANFLGLSGSDGSLPDLRRQRNTQLCIYLNLSCIPLPVQDNGQWIISRRRFLYRTMPLHTHNTIQYNTFMHTYIYFCFLRTSVCKPHRLCNEGSSVGLVKSMSLCSRCASFFSSATWTCSFFLCTTSTSA